MGCVFSLPEERMAAANRWVINVKTKSCLINQDVYLHSDVCFSDGEKKVLRTSYCLFCIFIMNYSLHKQCNTLFIYLFILGFTIAIVQR